MYSYPFVFALISVFGTVGASCPEIVSRAKWGAKEGRTQSSMAVHPASHVIIHHSSTPKCTSQSNCKVVVRSLQRLHMKYKDRSDIGYNFLVGEDGNIYEGVGWDKAATNIPSHDRKSVHICAIGDYTSSLPSSSSLKALKEIIECGVSRGSISEEYRLVAHSQLQHKECPGRKLYEEIQMWPNASPY